MSNKKAKEAREEALKDIAEVINVSKETLKDLFKTK